MDRFHKGGIAFVIRCAMQIHSQKDDRQEDSRLVLESYCEASTGKSKKKKGSKYRIIGSP